MKWGLVFIRFQRKLFFVDFQQGEQSFWFWIDIPSQSSENDEPP